MNKKILLAIIPIVVVIVAAIGVLMFLLLAPASSNDIYLEQVTMAQRHLDSGDVDQAIVCYQKAIEADEMKEEPYIALARVYYNKKYDSVNALGTVKKGYDKIGSETLHQWVDYFTLLSGENVESETTVPEGSAEKKGVINSTYLDTFSTYTYQNYKDRCTMKSERTVNDAYIVSYTQYEAEFEYKNTADNTVLDKNSGKPLANVRPTAIRVDSLKTLISGIDQGVTADDLKANGVTDIQIVQPDGVMGSHHMVFTYQRCSFAVECDKNGTITNTNGANVITPPKSNVSSQSVLNGYVVSAVDNTPVSNVKVNIRSGKNTKSGAPLKSVDAPNGMFTAELDEGDYTVEAIADGFISEFYDAYIPSGGAQVNLTFVMSPKLKENQMRFVVEWSNTQYDLYIHVRGTSSDRKAVQYWEHAYSSTDYANSVGGFETGEQNGKRFTAATIMDSKGDYEFHVHGGEDQYQLQVIKNADVVVKVYKDNESAPTVINLPKNFHYNYWTVCSVHDGNIVLIDE